MPRTQADAVIQSVALAMETFSVSPQMLADEFERSRNLFMALLKEQKVEIASMFKEYKDENAFTFRSHKDENAAALKEYKDENAATLKEYRDENAATLKEYRDENAATLKEYRDGVSRQLREHRKETNQRVDAVERTMQRYFLAYSLIVLTAFLGTLGTIFLYLLNV